MFPDIFDTQNLFYSASHNYVEKVNQIKSVYVHRHAERSAEALTSCDDLVQVNERLKSFRIR